MTMPRLAAVLVNGHGEPPPRTMKRCSPCPFPPPQPSPTAWGRETRKRCALFHVNQPTRQRGVALVIVLILLLVMTLLGLASMRGTLLEERMSGNLFDRSLAFQAAEAALREAEGLILAAPPVFPASGCVSGFCAQPVSTLGVPERAVDPAFTGWRLATASVGTLASQPEFIIESLGVGETSLGCNAAAIKSPTCLAPRYRIAARSAAVDRAQVILQTTFTTP